MICTHPVTNDSANSAGKAELVLGNSPLLRGFVGSLRDLRFYDRLTTLEEVSSLADNRSTREIAEIPYGQRSVAESKTLRLAFLESECLPDDLRELHEASSKAHENLAIAIRQSPTTMVMKESQTEPTRIRLAGVFDSLGVKVSASTPDFLPEISEVRIANGVRESDDQAITQFTRLDLANWLTHPTHPLTSRVAVNRVWQSLWGRALSNRQRILERNVPSHCMPTYSTGWQLSTFGPAGTPRHWSN